MPRGKDGLYRRDGVLAFRYKDHDGRWREKFTGTTNRTDAREFKTQFLENLKKGALPTKMADWRLDQAEKWWIEFRTPRIASGTLNSERYRLKNFARLLGNKRLREITNADLDRYANKRLEEEIGAHSINKEILLLSLMLKKAKLWSRLRDDHKPLRTKASDIGRALTRDELRTLATIAQTNQDWEAAFYGSVLAANTGLRGGEIKKLRIGSIDIANRRIVIRRASAKTDASARHIELNADATQAAKRLLFRAAELGSNRPEHYLMPKHMSRIMYGPDKGKRGYDPLQHQAYWDTAWKNLTEAVPCPRCGKVQAPADTCKVKKCGVDMKGITSPFAGFNFHSCRHTFVTHMVERGVPLGVIQTFVGHMSARMVRHYTHISTGAARKAVELLDREPILAEENTEVATAPPKPTAPQAPATEQPAPITPAVAITGAEAPPITAVVQ